MYTEDGTFHQLGSRKQIIQGYLYIFGSFSGFSPYSMMVSRSLAQQEESEGTSCALFIELLCCSSAVSWFFWRRAPYSPLRRRTRLHSWPGMFHRRHLRPALSPHRMLIS